MFFIIIFKYLPKVQNVNGVLNRIVSCFKCMDEYSRTVWTCKVYIFWEGNKILQNLHRRFDWHYIGQITVEISQNFVAFSEYINFIWPE